MVRRHRRRLKEPAIARGDLVYLREDVRAEPLVGGFRAWAHLVAPHTHARRTITRNLPRLEQTAQAVRDTDDENRAVGLRDLIHALAAERSAIVRFGEAIAELDALLLTKAKGLSLDALYAEVPEPMRGRVELLYDRYNQPTVRFLEGALYRSELYDPSLQTVRLEQVDPDLPGEPLSTPRTPQPGRLILPAPFADEMWDHLGRARRRPLPLSDLAERLGTSAAQLAPFVTAQPPGRWRFPAAAPRTTFLNHACVLVEGPEAATLLDPLVAYRRHGSADRISFADLPALQYLAITHAHLDHLDLETLLQIRHLTGRVIIPPAGAGSLLDPSLQRVLTAVGFRDVVEADDFDAVRLPGGSITALPFFGEHSDLAVRGKAGYAVTLGSSSSVFVADSQCLDERVYRTARDLLGEVGAAFIGMECEGSPMTTAMGPYLPDGLHTEEMAQSRRTKGSDAAAALRLVGELEPKAAYIYAMGLEPWLSYMFGVPDRTRSYSLAQTDEFIARCAERGLPARLLSGSQSMDF